MPLTSEQVDTALAERLGIAVVVKRVSFVLDHDAILALAAGLDILPVKAGVAYLIELFSAGHPEWNEGYNVGGDVRFSGTQILELDGGSVFGTAAVLSVQPRATDPMDIIADVGQALTLTAILPTPGSIAAKEHTGLSPAGSGSEPSTAASGGSGSGALFNVEWSNFTPGVYDSVAINLGSGGYEVDDELTILGSQLSGGVDGLNDITITVVAVNAGVVTGGEEGNELSLQVDYTERTL